MPILSCYVSTQETVGFPSTKEHLHFIMPIPRFSSTLSFPDSHSPLMVKENTALLRTPENTYHFLLGLRWVIPIR